MCPKLVSAVLLHVAFRSVHAGFLSSLGSAIGGVAQDPGRAGQAVLDSAQQAAAAVEGASLTALKAAGDAVLAKSKKCEHAWAQKSQIASLASPLVARGLQESEVDPSADVPSCRRVGMNIGVEWLHENWNDVTGLTDQIARGMLDDVTEFACGPDLMQALKKEEPIRKKNATEYKAHLEKTLRESVFIDVWIEDVLKSHCGEEPAFERLFALSSKGVSDSWRQTFVAWSLSLTTVLAALGLLLVARRRHQQAQEPSEHLLFVESASEGGDMDEDDAVE